MKRPVCDLGKLEIQLLPDQNRIIYAGVVIATLVFLFSIGFFRSKLFIYGSYDTAFYLQALWRLSQFQRPISSFNELFPILEPVDLFMGHHFQYSALLLAPFFRLGLPPLDVILYVVPAFSLSLAVFFWSRLFPKPADLFPGVVGLMLLCWSDYSGMFSSEFYLDKFAAPWVIASIYFLQTRKLKWLLLSLVIVTGFKEYFALFAASVCIVYWLRNRKRMALLFGIGFLLYTAVIVAWVMPCLGDGNPLVLVHFGGSLHDSPSAFIRYIIGATLRWRTIQYLFSVNVQFLFLPLLIPHLFVLSLPILACNIGSGLLSKGYYTALPNAVLAVAFVYGFRSLRQAISSRLDKNLSFAILMLILFLAVPYSSLRRALYRVKVDSRVYASEPEHVSQLRDVLADVSEDDVLAVCRKLSPYVARNTAYIFPKPFNDSELSQTVNKIIIAKHHPSYLHNFDGSLEQFEATVREIADEYHFEVEVDSGEVLYLTKSQ